MILTEKLFKMRYRVGASVKPPLIIHAAAMNDADDAVMLHAAGQPGYEGEEIRIIAATEIDLEAL